MNKLPLVLVHGFMGGSEQWSAQVEHFADCRPVITPDLPGFASKSDNTAPDKIEGFARSVLDELSSMQIDEFALLGHSMGGMIVQGKFIDLH